MHWFTALFLAALAASTTTRLWLALRQLRHVAGHRGSVPPGFEDRIALAAHQKAADYTAARTRLGALETVVGALVVLAFTVGGGLQRLIDAWSAILEAGGYAHGAALVVSVVVISSLVDLPFSAVRAFVIEERFGFNRMTLGLFLADLAKQAALSALLGIPLLFCVLWLMARAGSAWWLYAWLTWVAFSMVVHLLYPTVFARWFNKFSPLSDPALKARIEALLAKCGFRAKGLFVMDGSRRSSHGNAYFTGFGASKRIVLFDTLVSRLPPPEIEAVLAHELGHYSLHHIWKRMALVFAGSLATLGLLGWLAEQQWFYTALGARTPGTAVALLLFFMAMPAFTFLLYPLVSLYSRKHEYEADAYAAEHADAAQLARALVKLYEDNAATLTPDPLHSAFYDSHPPAAHRIARLQARGA
jgi:STE24 endopeptidase